MACLRLPRPETVYEPRSARFSTTAGSAATSVAGLAVGMAEATAARARVTRLMSCILNGRPALAVG